MSEPVKVRDLTDAEMAVVLRRKAQVDAMAAEVRHAQLRHQDAQHALNDVLAALHGGSGDPVTVKDGALWEQADG